MAKKYVVENAALNCQYGEESWLIVPGDRHIEISGRLMANETDYKRYAWVVGASERAIVPMLHKG